MPESIWPIYLEASYYLLIGSVWLTFFTIALSLLVSRRKKKRRCRKVTMVVTFGPVSEQKERETAP